MIDDASSPVPGSVKSVKEMTMTIHVRSIALPMRSGRCLAVAALLGATMLVGPMTSAHAQSAPPTRAGAAAMATKGETVEQRIATLRTSLKITPEEDANWKAVAQAMRENASNMDKLIAEGRTSAPGDMSAVDDLKMYQKLTQAHVDGLKNLISSFSTLYSAMPDAQKKVADTVFAAPRQGATG
jgi:hypothetical protein